MTNCDWLNSKLESYFCDTLTDEELRRFESHLASCDACKQQIESFRSIDPMVRPVLQRRLALAQRAAQIDTRPRVLRLAFGTAGLAAAAVVLVIGVRFFQQEIPPPPALVIAPEVPLGPDEVKKEDPQQPFRARLSGGDSVKPAPQPELDVALANGPEFEITDAQGYTTTLEPFRGRVFLFGVISSDQQTATNNFQQIYDTFQANRGIRMLAVARHREDDLDTKIPLYFNNGSRLMGVEEGQYLLIDAAGKSSLKGSLSDSASVTRLKNQLNQLGIR
jgi:Putative zinc-finger